MPFRIHLGTVWHPAAKRLSFFSQHHVDLISVDEIAAVGLEASLSIRLTLPSALSAKKSIETSLSYF